MITSQDSLGRAISVEVIPSNCGVGMGKIHILLQVVNDVATSCDVTVWLKRKEVQMEGLRAFFDFRLSKAVECVE